MDITAVARIRAFVVQHFPSARNRTLRDDEHLLTSGILDSLGVLDVVAFLEETFRISVVDEDLVPEHFESLQNIAAFVASKSSHDSGRPA
jgi:acyl carrier protein